jgi:serine/threonine protein kinase
MKPGSVLAPGYVVREHLARTRRLDTYEVWSEERACSCVAKTLRPDRRGDRRARTALLDEGERLLALSHPHIVRGYELVRRPQPVVVMETLAGETVAHLVDRRARGLPAGEVAWLGLHLASALRYLHGHGLLHLDIKPSNVIAEGGRAKVIDLSVARPPGRMRPGIGTWATMAPEQARGGEIGPAADVWGVGVVLFEAATGCAPFEDDGGWTSATTSTLGEEAADSPPQLERPAPPVRRRPAALAAAIGACLRADPGDRPTLAELTEQLAPCAG